jgi:hypothetical protein
MSNARPPSRTGLSPSSRSRCAASSRYGPNEIACSFMRRSQGSPHSIQFYSARARARSRRRRAVDPLQRLGRLLEPEWVHEQQEDPRLLRRRVREAQPVSRRSRCPGRALPICNCSIEEETRALLLNTLQQAEPLYQLEKEGGFRRGDSRGIAFATSRLAASAAALRDMIVDAWFDSGDTSVRANLLRSAPQKTLPARSPHRPLVKQEEITIRAVANGSAH